MRFAPCHHIRNVLHNNGMDFARSAGRSAPPLRGSTAAQGRRLVTVLNGCFRGIRWLSGHSTERPGRVASRRWAPTGGFHHLNGGRRPPPVIPPSPTKGRSILKPVIQRLFGDRQAPIPLLTFRKRDVPSHRWSVLACPESTSQTGTRVLLGGIAVCWWARKPSSD